MRENLNVLCLIELKSTESEIKGRNEESIILLVQYFSTRLKKVMRNYIFSKTLEESVRSSLQSSYNASNLHN